MPNTITMYRQLVILVVWTFTLINVDGKVRCFTCFSLRDPLNCGDKFKLPPPEADLCDASCEKTVSAGPDGRAIVERRCGIRYIYDEKIESRSEESKITYFCNDDFCNNAIHMRNTVQWTVLLTLLSVATLMFS